MTFEEGGELHGPDQPDHEWFASGTVDMRKFDEYLLCPTHRVGKGKLKKWESAFGIGEGDGQLLWNLIGQQLWKAEIIEHEPEPHPEAPDRVLRLWELNIRDFEGPNGNMANVQTAWALDPDRDLPHLVTAYPKWLLGERATHEGN